MHAHTAAEELLLAARPDQPRRVRGRELTVEAVLCCAVLLGAIAWPALTAPAVDLAPTLACLLAYAAAARVRFYVGGGAAQATQLAFIPMLWTLPPATIPLCVVAALVLAPLPDVVRGAPVERLMIGVGDSAYAFAPAILLAATGDGGTPGVAPLLAAFVVQCAFDAAVSTAREALSRGIGTSVQLTVMATVWGVDTLLLPLGFALAVWTERSPLAVLSVLPFSLLLAALARDRNRRLGDASDRLEDLERERERVRVAIHRVARSLGAGLDRRTVLEVALGTAVDAVGAEAGRARLAGASESLRFEAIPRRTGAVDAPPLLAAERAALAGSATAATSDDGWQALARPIRCRRDGRVVTIGAIAVCRDGAPFTRDEQDLFSYLAAQAAASIESIDAHERLESQNAADGLTGLANRRRFQDLMRVETERAMRATTPLTLLLLELDGLERLRAVHGDGAAAALLREVGACVRRRCRFTDEPARYGEDRIGVVLSDTTLAGAELLADDLRAGIAHLRTEYDGVELGITASIGLASLGRDLDSREAIVAAAESALREAAVGDGDRTVAFTPAHGEHDRRAGRSR